MFTRAIVRTPCKAMVNGLTTASLGEPNYELALLQHLKYIEALERCGLKVSVLPPDENFPDSCFVEDPALLIPECAIITNPGAATRKGESELIKPALEQFFSQFEFILPPGTVEAGDILKIENHFYIGISDRTNDTGAQQMIAILQKYGYSASTVELSEVLHLKTGVSYLGDGCIAAAGEFITGDPFSEFKIISIPAYESYAANCLRLNDYVLLPAGFPETKEKFESAGFNTLTVDVSEFRKIDGGLSCLSLRF